MRNQIIDDFGVTSQAIYSSKSLNWLLFSVFFYLLIIAMNSFQFYVGNESGYFYFILNLFSGFGALISNILGFTYSIKAFINKEPLNIKKWAGLIGNLLIFLIISLVIYASVLDLLRYLN